MMGCIKCRRVSGVLLLLFGIIFLLKDLMVWDFWGINWWTVLMLLVGLGSVMMGTCADCTALCTPDTKKK
jgi:hypothetical protein